MQALQFNKHLKLHMQHWSAMHENDDAGGQLSAESKALKDASQLLPLTRCKSVVCAA